MLKKILPRSEALRYVLSKGGLSFTFRMAAMGLSFASMWIMTHFFGSAAWGMYSLALTLLQISTVIFSMGLPNAFIGFSGGLDNSGETIGLFIKSAKLALLFSIVPFIVFTAGAGIISTSVFGKEGLYNYLLIVAIGTPFMIIHEILCFYFIAIKRFTLYGIALFILPNVIFIASLLVLYYNETDTWTAFLAYVGGHVFTIMVGLAWIFGRRPKIVYPSLVSRDILRKAVPMMVSGIFLLLLNWTDVLMLGRFVEEEQIGIYNTAFKLGYLSLFFVGAMNAVIMPRVSELFYQKNMAEMKKVVNRSTQVVILLTLPLAFILMFFSELILEVFGKGFVTGSATLILVTLGGLYNAMTGNVDQILNMTNNQKTVSKVFFSGFLLNVVLNLFMIPGYGIEGAAAASLITNIVVNTAFIIIIKKKLGFYTFI